MEGAGNTLGAGFRASAAGVQAGGDTTVGASGRIGFALAYERSWIDDENGGSGHGDAVHASIYASQPLGPVGLSAAFTYSRAWDNTRRPTGVGTASAKRDFTGLTGGVQLSAPLSVRGALLTPAAGVLVSHIKADGFRETGGGLPGFAVIGLDRDKTFVSPFASLGLSYAFTSRGGVTWVPDAEIGYRRSNAAAGIDTVLVSEDGTRFGSNRASLDRNVVTAGASFSAHKGRWTGYVNYRAQVADGWTDHGGAIGFRWAF
jgi:outer membrane autotransporter protein